MNNCMGMFTNGTKCVSTCADPYANAPELSCNSNSSCNSTVYNQIWKLNTGENVCMDSCYTYMKNSLNDTCRVYDSGNCEYISQEKYLCYSNSTVALLDSPSSIMVGRYVFDSGTSVTTTLNNLIGISTTRCSLTCLTYPFLTAENTVCTLPTTLLKVILLDLALEQIYTIRMVFV